MHDRELGPHKTQFRRDDNYGKVLIFKINLSLLVLLMHKLLVFNSTIVFMTKLLMTDT